MSALVQQLHWSAPPAREAKVIAKVFNMIFILEESLV